MNRIFVTGDIHGNAGEIRNIVSQIDNPTKDDIIIVCGDAGFEYQEYIMGEAKRAARKFFPGTWIVLRGNHDSCYWNDHCTRLEDGTYIPHDGWALTQDGMYLYQNKYPNIWYVIDGGGIYNIGGYNFLMIPGAYSVDKWYRLRMGYPWNRHEQLNAQERNDLESITIEWLDMGFDIDFVIAHTFPMKMQHFYQDLFLSGLDQSSVDKTMEIWLNEFANIYENVPNFKHYFGGHFHDDRMLNDKYTMLYHDVVNLADYVEE